MEDRSISRWTMWRRRLEGFKPFVSGMLGAALMLLIYHFVFNRAVERDVKDVALPASPRLGNGVDVYNAIRPSVVTIDVTYEDGSSVMGAGVIVTELADIVTSLHVVHGSRNIQITFVDGSKSKALILAESPEQGTALLRAYNTPSGVVPAVLGNPNAMQVGDDVYAIGNPFGLAGSMSVGVVSGLDRSFQPAGTAEPLSGLIQFDAAVNPGSAGGPLLDRNGRVIGIVTGWLSPLDGDFFVGIGFATPITSAAPGASGSPPY